MDSRDAVNDRFWSLSRFTGKESSTKQQGVPLAILSQTLIAQTVLSSIFDLNCKVVKPVHGAEASLKSPNPI